MASFEIQWPVIVREEGTAFVQNDAGVGSAQYGINSAFHPEVFNDEETPGRVTAEEAQQIYRTDYWNRIGGSSILSQKVAGALMDSAVNQGVTAAVKMAQKVLGVGVDGIVGPITLNALNSANENGFLNSFFIERVERYKTTWNADRQRANPRFLPNQLEQWIERAARFKGSESIVGNILGAIVIYFVLVQIGVIG